LRPGRWCALRERLLAEQAIRPSGQAGLQAKQASRPNEQAGDVFSLLFFSEAILNE